jgi:SSS family solute:Na+ symporter
MPAKGLVMLGVPVTVLILVVVLGVFAWVGLAVGRDRDLEQFAVARKSQSGTALGLSFFASGVGAWILFAAPEVGASVGIAGVLGYAVAITVPLAGLVLVSRQLRTLVPTGHNLIEFVAVRYGRSMHLYVLGISLVYMLVALAAELTSVGAVLGRLSDADPRLGVMAVAAVTALYTAYGGLRASIRTDRWQAWLLLALLVVVGGALATGLPPPTTQDTQALFEVGGAGIEGALTLIAAVLATTLFHNGYWQRVWAARDDRALTNGALIGAATRFPVVFLAGLVGLLAAASGVGLGTPPVPFFAVLDGLPDWVLVVVLVLTLALVSSTVDTLQKGLAAVVVTERPAVGLVGGRVATVALTVLPTLVAFQGYSVLRLFLIADLFCAATIVPALLGLWGRSTSSGAVSGAVAGLAGALGYGYAAGGSLPAAVALATFSGGLALPPFLAAFAASTTVTVLVSLAGRRRADLAILAQGVRPLSPRVQPARASGTEAQEGIR